MAWNELFGSAVGLASLLTIVGVIVIGYGLYRFVSKKIEEEAK
jgi:plastocyanin domain-containing protein